MVEIFCNVAVMSSKKAGGKSGCLICGDSDKKLTRGLCPAHHAQYLRVRKAAFDPDAFDTHLIHQGMLLASKQGRRLASGENPFGEELAEFESNTTSGEIKLNPETGKYETTFSHMSKSLAEHVAGKAEQLAEQYVEEAAAEPTAKKPPKKGRAGGTRKKS